MCILLILHKRINQKVYIYTKNEIYDESKTSNCRVKFLLHLSIKFTKPILTQYNLFQLFSFQSDTSQQWLSSNIQTDMFLSV